MLTYIIIIIIPWCYKKEPGGGGEGWGMVQSVLSGTNIIVCDIPVVG